MLLIKGQRGKGCKRSNRERLATNRIKLCIEGVAHERIILFKKTNPTKKIIHNERHLPYIGRWFERQSKCDIRISSQFQRKLHSKSTNLWSCRLSSILTTYSRKPSLMRLDRLPRLRETEIVRSPLPLLFH